VCNRLAGGPRFRAKSRRLGQIPKKTTSWDGELVNNAKRDEMETHGISPWVRNRLAGRPKSCAKKRRLVYKVQPLFCENRVSNAKERRVKSTTHFDAAD
jgi:hypothetical protein